MAEGIEVNEIVGRPGRLDAPVVIILKDIVGEGIAG